MPISSRSALLVAAAQIRNEIADRANTAVRIGDEFTSVIDSMALVIDATGLGAVSGGPAGANTTAIAAAVARAIATNGEVYLPEGTFETNASIPDLHTVRWRGSGRILRGSDTFYVEPKPGQTNRLYVATTGSAANDGLTASQPRNSIQSAFDAMENYGPMLGGNWRVQVAAGTYTNQPVLVEGLQSADYIVVAGATVAMNATPTVRFDGTGATAVEAMAFAHNMIVKVENIRFQNWTVLDSAGLVARHRVQLWAYNVHADTVDETGLYAQAQSRLYVQGGNYTNCSKGIRVAQQSTFTIGQGGDVVTCQDCEYGAHLRNQSAGVVVNAEFIDCTVYGVQLLHSSEARFTSCLFDGNSVGINITGSAWFDDGCTFTGNTVDVETPQHSGELFESFAYFYEHATGRHGWGATSAAFTAGTKYHFRALDAGGVFHAGASMGLEAADPVFSFLTDNVSATAFGGIYFAKPGGTSIGQFVYRYDDNSLRFTVGSTAMCRMYSTDIRPNADNTTALGTTAARWAASHVVLRHWTSTVFDSSGTGTPEGAVTANIGSTYRRTDGGAGTSFYVKESGNGANTGWVAK